MNTMSTIKYRRSMLSLDTKLKPSHSAIYAGLRFVLTEMGGHSFLKSNCILYTTAVRFTDGWKRDLNIIRPLSNRMQLILTSRARVAIYHCNNRRFNQNVMLLVLAFRGWGGGGIKNREKLRRSTSKHRTTMKARFQQQQSLLISNNHQTSLIIHPLYM